MKLSQAIHSSAFITALSLLFSLEGLSAPQPYLDPALQLPPDSLTSLPSTPSSTESSQIISPRFPYPLGKTRIDPTLKPAYTLKQENIRYLDYKGYYSIYDVKVNTPLLTVEHKGKDVWNQCIQTQSNSPNSNGKAHRPKHGHFHSDERLSVLERIDHEAYRDDTGTFSRGHLTPSGDFDTRILKLETFMTTNIAPQYQRTFNDGVWSVLEQSVHQLTEENPNQGYTVITGVVHDDPTRAMRLNDKVSIPDYFYKIIINEESFIDGSKSVTAFLMENRKYANYEKNICRYIVPIRQIEALTGLNFLISIPEEERREAIEFVGNLDGICP